MEEFTPDLLEELQGIADAARLKKEDLNGIILYDCSHVKDYYKPNYLQRCTVFLIPGKDTQMENPIFARNYDWLKEAQQYFSLHKISPKNKLRSILLTDHFVGGFGGMNECGLAVGCTLAAYYNGQVKPQIMLNMAIRWILDNFRDVEEAVGFLEKVPLSEAYIFLIADSSGASARVEATPESVETSLAHDEFMIATNHFQSKKMKKYEVEITPANAHTTFTRLEGIDKWYRTQNWPITINSVKSILRSHEYGICDHNGEAGTLWSWVANLGANLVEVCGNSPCLEEYSSVSVL